MTIQSLRRSPHMAFCKASLVAKDKTGLQKRDVLEVLNTLPDAALVLVELAFDFGWSSGVDGAYVRGHGLFGKARPNRVGTYHCWDCWGARKAAKFVRSYYKKELRVHRLELQLNRKFLRRAKISRISDLWKLGSVLPGKELWFAKVDLALAKRQMRMAGRWGRGYYRACERLIQQRGDLLAQCGVLRKYGGVKNVRRVLAPMKENELVISALKKWLAQWAKGPEKGVTDYEKSMGRE